MGEHITKGPELASRGHIEDDHHGLKIVSSNIPTAIVAQGAAERFDVGEREYVANFTDEHLARMIGSVVRRVEDLFVMRARGVLSPGQAKRELHGQESMLGLMMAEAMKRKMRPVAKAQP